VIIGVDNDPAMFARACPHTPAAAFAQGDLRDWANPAAWEIVYSNAALQWVPDHATVFPRLLAACRPAFTLAVQMPAHLKSPIHSQLLLLSQRPNFT